MEDITMKKTYITPALFIYDMDVSLVLCGSLGSGETPNADISSAFESEGDEWADARGGFFDD